MDNTESQTIYLISGPCGVGKSTVAKELAKQVGRSSLIIGDAMFVDMFSEGDEPPWNERVSMTWENVLCVTRNFLKYGRNVVIDFIVEDELEWFCRQLSDLHVRMKYVVLRAEPETLRERLMGRGDSHLLERSLFLLNQLANNEANHGFLVDTTERAPHEVVRHILVSSELEVALP